MESPGEGGGGGVGSRSYLRQTHTGQFLSAGALECALAVFLLRASAFLSRVLLRVSGSWGLLGVLFVGRCMFICKLVLHCLEYNFVATDL